MWKGVLQVLEAGVGVECIKGIVWCALHPPQTITISEDALKMILDQPISKKNAEERNTQMWARLVVKVRKMIESGDPNAMKIVKTMVERGGALLGSLAIALCELAVTLRPKQMAVIFRIYRTCLKAGLGGAVLASR